MKTCSGCKIAQPLTNFYKDFKRKDGLKAYCKTCVAAISAAYRADNPEKEKAHKRTIISRYGSCKRSAKRRSISFDITLEQYKALIANPCYYSGHALPETGGGLDRIDSSKGYIIGNVVPCCSRCNNIFNKYDKQETYEHLALMLKMQLLR